MRVDPFIEAEKTAGSSVTKTCGLLEVSKSAYLPAPQRRPLARADHRRRVARADQGDPRGVQGHLWRPADPQGAHAPAMWPAGKRRVTRLMRQAGLEGRCKKRLRKTTVADPTAEAALDLIQRHFGPCEEMDRRYVGDITYIGTWEGWAYLATVIDLASRRVVGWALADHMRTELVEDALTMAFANRAPEEGVIFHSDRGCQYTSRDFAELARANGVVLSVGRKGECWDNAVAESFFATIKRELIDDAAHGRRGPDFDARSSSTSRAGTTPADCTSTLGYLQPRSSRKLSITTPSVRRHNRHKQPVRQSGSSPGQRLVRNTPLRSKLADREV